MIERRKFLKFLGISPYAAKKMAGLGAELMDPNLQMVAPNVLCSGSVSVPEPGIEGSALASLLRRIGIPEWKKREIRMNARYSRLLDPDIAALHSLPESTKVRMQWKLNEERMTNDFLEGITHDEKRANFRSKFNVTQWF